MSKRSDDSDPLAIVVNRLSQELSDVKAELQALKNARDTRAAFFVNTGPTPLNVTAKTPIKFRGEVFDIVHCYNPTLGMFSPPVAGIYILSLQIYPYLSQDNTVDLYKNGVAILRMRVYDQSMETSESASLVVHAGKSDKYWVQMNHDGTIHSTIHSFFSGVLISPDP